MLVGAGAALRLALLPTLGYDLDIQTFIAWSEAVFNYGLTGVYDIVFPPPIIGFNYPPVFYYLLWGLAKFFGPLTLMTVKLPAISLDIIAGLVIWYVLRGKRFAVQTTAAAFVLLNPAVFLVSAYWGQVDILHTLIALLALMAAVQKRFLVSAILFTLAFFTKIQSIIFLPPLIALCVFARRSVLKAFLAALATAVIIVLPFIVTGNLSDLFHPLLGIIQGYPYLTVNAMNIWWPVTGGVFVPDHTPFFGVPGIYLGMTLLTLAVAFAIRFLARHRSLPDIMFAAAFITLAFFFFSTDMHERYFFPVFILLPLALSKYWRQGLVLLGMLSLSFAANIFYVLPRQAPLLADLTGWARYLLVDSWWIVNGLALLFMFATMQGFSFYKQYNNALAAKKKELH